MQPSRAHTTPTPPITLVGAGRVGGSLFRALLRPESKSRLVGRDDVGDGCARAEVVVLCVPDAEIERCLLAGGGGRPSPPLRRPHERRRARSRPSPRQPTRGAAGFSLHPLQTIPDAESDLTGAPVAIAATTAAAATLAREIAERCQMVPFDVPEDSRAAYHAAAAIASNFLVALETSAEELLAAAGIENGRELLAPARPADRGQLGRARPGGPDRPDRPRRRGDRRPAPRGDRRDRSRARVRSIAPSPSGRARSPRRETADEDRRDQTRAPRRPRRRPSRRHGRSASCRRWAPSTTATSR